MIYDCTSVEDEHAIVLDQRQVGLRVQRRDVGRVVDRVRAHRPLRQAVAADHVDGRAHRVRVEVLSGEDAVDALVRAGDLQCGSEMIRYSRQSGERGSEVIRDIVDNGANAGREMIRDAVDNGAVK